MTLCLLTPGPVPAAGARDADARSALLFVAGAVVVGRAMGNLQSKLGFHTAKYR